MNKKQWNTPSVSNLTLEKTMSGTCPLKAKHVVDGMGTCNHFCTVCGGCMSGDYNNPEKPCYYNQQENGFGQIHRCTCTAIS